MKIKVEVEDITWECDDCGNVYDLSIPNCPNKILNSIQYKKIKKQN